MEEPRIKMRWVNRENGNCVLQVFVPDQWNKPGENVSVTSGLGWVDVPVYQEKIEKVS